MSKRLSRLTLIAVTAAGLAFSTGTASAGPGNSAGAGRTDDAPGSTAVDQHRPVGVGQGRKVG